MAFIQASFCPGLSNETPKTVKFLSLNLWNAATTVGFSRRQGPHQLAQKSTSTYLPRNEDNERLFPAVSGNVKSGAMDPTANLPISAIFASSDLPNLDNFNSVAKASKEGLIKSAKFSGDANSSKIVK